MNGLLPSLGGVALFAAAGLGLAELVPAVRTLPWPRRLAWAYLFGIAGLGGALYALSHFVDVPLRRPAILGTAAILAATGIAARAVSRRRHRRGPHPLGPPLPSPPRQPGEGEVARSNVDQASEGGFPLSRGKGGRWERGTEGVRSGGGRLRLLKVLTQPWAAPALLAFICLGLFADAVTDPVTGWDGRMTWSTQALWVQDEGTVDSEVLRRKNLHVTHPQYPLLLPVAQVVVLETFSVPPDIHSYRALYTTFFAAFLLLLWDGGRRWAGRLPTLLSGLAAAGVPALTFYEDSGAASGYSDLPLGCFYGAGLLLLLRSRRRIADAFGAGLLLAGAALIKNEGALLAFFALGAAAFVLQRKELLRPRQLFRLGAAVLPVLLALALLASWRAEIPNRQDERYGHLVATMDWSGLVTRIPLISSLALRQTFRFDHWTLFWVAVPVIFWVGRRGWGGRRRRLALALGAGALAPLVIAWGAYSIHPHTETLIPVTWTRFLIQGSLPWFLLLALALREVLARVSQENATVRAVPAREGAPRARRAGPDQRS